MAATDKTYRSPKALDIVFAVSCILMLISVIVMFAQDYYREFKVVQREFRDVETSVFERAMVAQLPPRETIDAVEQMTGALTDARNEVKKKQDEAQAATKGKRVELVKLEADLQALKADYDSFMSLYNIDVDEGHTAAANAKKMRLEQMDGKIAETQRKIDAVKAEMNQAQEPVKELEKAKARELYAKLVEKDLAPPLRAEDIETLSQCEDPLKRQTAELDRLAKAAAQKKWKPGDWFRALPVIDGFASPYRIEQYTLDKLPIDYNFKHVTRYDRCHTCHLGMERAGFDRETLTGLKDAPDDLQNRLDRALAFFKAREAKGEKLSFDVGDLPGKVKAVNLTPAQVSQYAAHPRLDLFVDSNSPHPGEKFGCTICHAGQGSSTDFFNASHMPSNAAQMKDWADKHHWHTSHYWDFPMLARRFTESSCLKCHHQVTDLIRHGSREEAPKLLRGYNLVRENGCFGCHEIAGIKGGRPVGPDMRLEPHPPLDAMTPAERTKMLADPLNPPGTMRKVGPSLYRLAEKTNEDWTRKWVMDPRGFRPDTRMPHFYNLSNNARDELPESQKDFPAAEVHAIAHFLFRESQAYLEGQDKYRQAKLQREKELLKKREDNVISERERKELDEVQALLKYALPPVPLAKRIIDSEGNPVEKLPAPAKGEELAVGARLFREKGCLACHSHDGTAKQETVEGIVVPGVMSDADFGPNLSRLAAKIAPQNGDAEARRRWLIQWVMNPNVHFPRTRMPITHLSVEEAARVADWLLSQPVEGWDEPKVDAPSSETLVALARVYLSKAPGMTAERVEDMLRNGFKESFFDQRKLPLDNDERALIGAPADDKLKYYIGRKAVNRLGCYGCHSVPGFDFAKPIGTPLNDWGKKDTERLAFEDIVNFVGGREGHGGHYNVVALRDDPKDPSKPAADWKFKDGKAPYEEYFADALKHQHDQTGRVGFLHQKLQEPRSFDYNRVRTWDDRLRMPQFQFARGKKRADESDEAFRLRASREEAEAREAVMTFILGLVAEPVPLDYLNKPAPDRLAEVKGRQVLDKFNCAGCHQVRAGVYDFKLTKDVREQLEDTHRAVQATAAADYGGPHGFKDNAWVGQLSPDPSRVRLFAVPRGEPDPEGKRMGVWLTEAVRFKDAAGAVADVPAGEEVFNLPLSDAVLRSAPYGGAFTDLMIPYLKARNKVLYDKDDTARAGLPPPLVREGEKVQPGWLYRFLRNPGKVRPQASEGDGFLILRMPRFNMSEDDAQALVNYFAAADRLANPNYGLTHPYLAIPQREEEFWREESHTYTARLEKDKALEKRLKALEPIWKQYRQDLEQQAKEAQAALKSAEADVQKAKDALDKADKDKKAVLAEALKRAEANRDSLKKFADQLKAQLDAASPESLDKQWKNSGVYGADAFRLLVRGPCLACHQAGGIGQAAKGPALELSAERLRPRWTERWLANPRRLTTYLPAMPQNFPRNQTELQDLFTGTSGEQVEALTDLLMDFHRQYALPANRYYLTSPGGN